MHHTMIEEVTAWHEAGHAFVAMWVGARVRSVTIEPADDDGPDRSGDTRVAWSKSRFTGRKLHESQVLVSLAGPVAEMLHTGDPWHPGLVPEWAGDWSAALTSAAKFLPEERERLAYLEQRSLWLYRWLRQDEPWACLGALVDNLLAHETLAGEDVVEIYETWML